MAFFGLKPMWFKKIPVAICNAQLLVSQFPKRRDRRVRLERGCREICGGMNHLKCAQTKVRKNQVCRTCFTSASLTRRHSKELQASSPNVADGGHADEADLCALQLCFFRRGQVVCQSPDKFSARARDALRKLKTGAESSEQGQIIAR